MNKTLFPENLDAEFHRCWTAHVHAPYNKSAFQALEKVINQAMAYAKEAQGQGLKHNFVVGDIVMSTPGYSLRSGNELYEGAVVVKTDPLVLVSFECDMRWQATVMPNRLQCIGKADQTVVDRCMSRVDG